MNVLFIGEDERGCWQLARRLEERGRDGGFAWTSEEIRKLLGRCAFPVVLSARPLIEGSSLMELLRREGRTVFYSLPMEDGCFWFRATREVPHGPRISAFRPNEITNVSGKLISAQAVRGG
jgi:hypothetical protein